jgi:hypothetical protein
MQRPCISSIRSRRASRGAPDLAAGDGRTRRLDRSRRDGLPAPPLRERRPLARRRRLGPVAPPGSRAEVHAPVQPPRPAAIVLRRPSPRGRTFIAQPPFIPAGMARSVNESLPSLRTGPPRREARGGHNKKNQAPGAGECGGAWRTGAWGGRRTGPRQPGMSKGLFEQRHRPDEYLAVG